MPLIVVEDSKDWVMYTYKYQNFLSANKFAAVIMVDN